MQSYPVPPRSAQPARARAIALSVVSVPFALFAAYVAWLVVPQVLQVVIPAVVRAVVSQ